MTNLRNLVGGRVVSACRRSCCCHFGSRNDSARILKELRLPWLSSLASQNGATGGITAQSSSARSCSCRAHVGNRAPAAAVSRGAGSSTDRDDHE